MTQRILLLFSFLFIFMVCRSESLTEGGSCIKFNYKDVQYTDCHAWFYIDDKECIIGSSKVASDKVFGIVISIEVEENKTYPVFNSTFKKIFPDIWIRFDGDSSIKETYEDMEKIGELTITEKTNSRLSGSFKCKLKYGEITGGEFSVTRNIVTEN